MKFFKKTDILIAAMLIGLGCLLFWWYNTYYGAGEAKAEIYSGSKLVKTMELAPGREQSFSVRGKEQVVFHLYEDGSIAFEESDCPDKVCINSGKLRRPGQSAACLPNGLIMKIVPKDKNKEGEHDVII